MNTQLPKQTRFVYTELNDSSSIRVLYLQPGHEADTIEVSLVETNIQNSTLTYSAISYVWGDSGNCSTIICSGSVLVIPETLYSILRRLRRRHNGSVVALWADSICINQARDPDALRERSQQVAMMGKIFSKAEKVFIDLTGTSLEGFEKLFELQAILETVPWAPIYPEKLRIDFARDEDPPGPEHSGWYSLAQLMCHPWFTRMWVMQEFAMAKSMVFLLNDDIERDATFIESIVKCACYFMYHEDLSIAPNVISFKLDIMNNYLNIALFHKIRMMLHTDHGVSLRQFHDILLCRNHYKATDSRDFIYALLGLAPNDPATFFEVDYNKPSCELGERLFLYLLAHGYGVICLYQSLGLQSPTTSWSVQLELVPRDLVFNVLSDGTSKHYNACGDTSPDIVPGKSNSSLFVKSFLVDKIASVFPAEVPQRPRVENLIDVENWLCEVMDWLRKLEYDPLGNDALSFARSICCGQYSDASDSVLPLVILPYLHRRRFASQYSAVDDPRNQAIYIHMLNLLDLIQSRSFAISTDGHFCFVPSNSVAGDLLAIFFGAPIPFVLRPKQTENGVELFRIVGACYVDGMMQGKGVESGLGPLSETIEIR